MKRYVGVDLHKRRFTVCVREGKEERVKEYEVSKRGIEKFKREELTRETEVALEATGNSGYFYDEIGSKVKRVVLINPLEFKAVSSTTKKTDKNDARVICKHLRADMLPEVRHLEEAERELRSLINLRDNFVKARSGYKAQIDSLLSASGAEEIRGEKGSDRYEEAIERMGISVVRKIEIKMLIGQIRKLTEDIKRLEEEIKKRGKKKEHFKGLTSISGIGELSATIIENAIVDIDDFENEKKLCSYAGLVPIVKESAGKNKASRTTRKGNKLLRTILVQCGLVAIRYNEKLKQFYLKIKNKKGHGKAIVAVARKLLVIIYYTMKNRWVFKDFNNGVLA